MTLTASMDALLEQTPAAAFPTLNSRTPFLFLGLALGAWVLSETLMAPVLRPFMIGLWLGYVACFFIFTAWYFRVSRLFDVPWTSYRQALPPMVWTLTPLHLLFPAALLCRPAGLAGMLAYEVAKAGVIVAVLSRLTHVLQDLNHWPRWSAVVLALSPLAVALAGIVSLVALGGVAVLALGLKALLH
jgi:hypothetical protein